MERYKIFFENLNLINKKYQLLNLNTEHFNIFSILRNEYDEVNLHSRFLVELLKNKNYGKKFFELFLINLGIENFNFKNIQVFSEYTVKKNGRIDILLKLSSSKERKVIIIENKIYADDQFQQLKRYYDSIVLEGYKEDEIEMVYLSLYGNEPSKNSISGLSGKIKDSIKVISYKIEILEWLESCIKEVVQVPIIRETLVQYERLLKKLTFKEEKNLSEELKNMILFNQEYLDILYKLPDVLDSIKIDLQLKFWEKLEERLSISLKEKGIVLEKGLTYPNYYYSKSLIEKFYRSSRNNKFYGLMFFIKEIENRGKLYLRIEVDSNLYYGFRIINSSGNSNQNKIDEYLEKELLNLRFERTDWWLGWKHIYNTENFNQTINLKEMNKELASILNDENKLEKLILEIEKEIQNTLEVIFNK